MDAAGRSRPVRLCHVCATTEGAAWLHEQLRDLRDCHGYDVTAILNGSSGGLVDRFRASGIRVLEADFDFTSSGDLFSLPRKVLRLHRLLRKERFDIVQTHLFHSMVIGRIAAWFADVPVRLAMVAGPFHLEAYTPRWIDRWTCFMETAIIASCTFMRTLYRGMGVPARKIELAFYGPDPARFDTSVAPADLRGEQGWAPDAPVVGMVAYFYPELGVNRWTPPAVQGRAIKRQEDFIRAARMILDERPEVRFLLVGSGWEAGGHAYMARMQALATELGLDPVLRFTGHRTDVPAVLRSLDVAVQASVNENLGGTIESLAMEAPTVATRVGGMVDTVIDGETGVLVEPANPADLKRGILRLLDDPEAARRMAKRGRAYMLSRFTLDHTVDDLHGIYTRRLAEAPRGYRPVVSVLRFAGGSVLCAVIVLRFVFLDLFWLPRWDAGWRPWHRARRLLGSAAFSLRHRVMPPPPEQVVAPAPPAQAAASPPVLPVSWARIALWRFYAFVGRHAPSGNRARLRAWLARLRGR